MPSSSCPRDENVFLEYLRGPKLSRLVPADYEKVAFHISRCRACQDKCIELHKGLPPEAGDPQAAEATQNVMALLQARIKARDRAEASARWRVRAALFAAAAVAVTAIGFFLFAPSKPDSPAVRIGKPAPWPDDVSDTGRARSDAVSLRERVAEADTPEALSLLVSKREALKAETPAYTSAALPELVDLHEQFLHRASDTPQEADSRLELSRLYQMMSRRPEWLSSFDAYVQMVGAKAGQDAAARNISDLDKRRLVYSAKATVYLEEVNRLYQEGNYTASIRLSDRLFALYPSSIRAYEGQMVAARCYLANEQGEEAIEAYTRIAQECPNMELAEKAGRTLLRMTIATGDVDRVAAEAQALRKRFAGEAFQRFTLMEEAKALQGGGESHYPKAISLFRDIQKRWPDSPEAKAAAESVRQMRTNVIPPDWLKLDGP